MSRIPLRTEDDFSDDCALSLEQEVLGEMNLLRARANNPPVLEAAREYVSALKDHGGLPIREVELAILSVARTLESTYEWHQHVKLAPTRGVTESEVWAIGSGALAEFTDAERALIEYASAVSRMEVDDETYRTFAAHFNERAIVGATALAAHYVETACLLDALDVPLEDEFVGWAPS